MHWRLDFDTKNGSLENHLVNWPFSFISITHTLSTHFPSTGKLSIFFNTWESIPFFHIFIFFLQKWEYKSIKYSFHLCHLPEDHMSSVCLLCPLWASSHPTPEESLPSLPQTPTISSKCASSLGREIKLLSPSSTPKSTYPVIPQNIRLVLLTLPMP